MSLNSGQPVKAAFWMFGTVISFSLMAVAAREASAELDTFEIMTYRSLVGLFVVATFAAATGVLRELFFRALQLHLARNILHFAATNLWLFAVATIPLAQVFALEFTTPLWTAILAPLLLREHLSKTRIVATIAGFAGILIILRPGFVEFSPGIAAALSCAIGFASAAVVTRRLVEIHSVTAILFWMCATQSLFSIVCAGIDLDIALPSTETLVPILAVTVCGLTAHLCLATALRIAPATLVMPMDFARLPFIAIVGLLLYNESIDTFFVVGAAIILFANLVNIRAAQT